jgi:D-ribulokinase
MALSKNIRFVPGVWGPYFSAVLPNYWLLEGGQSASGKLIDHIIEAHPAKSEAEKLASDSGLPIQQYLEDVLEQSRKEQVSTILHIST